MEKKKVKLSVIQVLLIMFGSALISVILFTGIFYIVNSLTKGNEKITKEIENDNSLEGYKEITEISERFVIFNYNENSKEYTLDTHILEDVPRKVSSTEIEDLLNGRTIRFRGYQWVLKDSSIIDEPNYYLRKAHIDDGNYLLISNSLNNKESAYTFRENNGGWNKLCDYESDALYTFKVDKEVKVGNTTNKFYYNEETSEVIVTDLSNNILTNSEEEVKLFFDSLAKLDESASSYGECIAYFINDKVVAIQTFTSTKP